LSNIQTLLAEARQRLREAGIPSAEADLDARLLAELALGWTTERFFTSANDAEPAGFTDRYQQLVSRRAAREPLAYIVGRREFWGLPFEITPDVLIPRPETELIIEAALELYPRADDELAIVDVCTGCGCIAIALARERRSARVIATDISARALDVALRNAAIHGVETRVDIKQADLLDGLVGPFDLIVANPPYVRDRDRPGLQPEVGNHEPSVALFGGNDGLEIVRRLVQQAVTRLGAGGYLIFEFGFGQDPSIETLIADASDLRLIELRRDLQGIARTAVARRI
jgi:release factor glutamine methyltransferase